MTRPIAILWMQKSDGDWIDYPAYDLHIIEWHKRYCSISEKSAGGYIPFFVEYL